MVIFNSYVKLPEGNRQGPNPTIFRQQRQSQCIRLLRGWKFLPSPVLGIQNLPLKNVESHRINQDKPWDFSHCPVLVAFGQLRGIDITPDAVLVKDDDLRRDLKVARSWTHDAFF